MKTLHSCNLAPVCPFRSDIRFPIWRSLAGRASGGESYRRRSQFKIKCHYLTRQNGPSTRLISDCQIVCVARLPDCDICQIGQTAPIARLPDVLYPPDWSASPDCQIEHVTTSPHMTCVCAASGSFCKPSCNKRSTGQLSGGETSASVALRLSGKHRCCTAHPSS